MTRRFQRIAVATTAITYLLILVGALVRASGAGMGCPDWPQCFGRWIPPTDLQQVPVALAPYFNLRLAWTEYLNRLLGVTTGLASFATLLAALRDHRRHARVLAPTVGAFVGVGLAGWLGKRIVERHLDPAFVTIHMLVALAVVGLYITAIVEASAAARGVGATHEDALHDARGRSRDVSMASLAVMSVVLVQIALGTRVRATLEAVARQHPGLPRGEWIAHVGATDHVHRTIALAVLAASIALAWFTRRTSDDSRIRRLSVCVVVGVIMQAVIGVGLAYAALPPVLQIAHVTVGSLVLGALLLMALLASRLPQAKAPTPVDRLASAASSGD